MAPPAVLLVRRLPLPRAALRTAELVPLPPRRRLLLLLRLPPRLRLGLGFGLGFGLGLGLRLG